jgi:Bacteriophage lambda head decoration protein D
MTINENPRQSDLVMFQEGEEVNYIVDVVTIVSGTLASAQGQILGKITASGKYTQVAPAAGDGSQNAAAVLLTPFTATLGADLTTALAITRGPCVLKANGIAYTSGMTAPQKTAALAQLAALGMLARTDYGV